MKICHVDPGCGLSIPPKSWGAIEKLIWEFHQNQTKLGYEVHIRMASDIKPKEFDVVHCHVANLALQLRDRGIPYIYQLHDHHAYHYGKDSFVFKENLEAIEHSLISLMPARFLVKYFNHPKCVYFSHGVNTDFFYPNPSTPKTKDFFMLANNGLAGNPAYDRKGFEFGVALAVKLGKSITIAGPKNNQNFFNNNLWTLGYPKLNIIFDPTQEEVRELYQSHKVFLHPTMLEAGHPNLTMIEAAACGLPVIADWEYETDFHGAWRSPRDIFTMEIGYKDIMSRYDDYSSQSLDTARNLSWYNRSIDLVKIYNEFL